MQVGNVARKGRRQWNRVGATWKRLLEEDNTGTAREHVSLELKKFIIAGDTTDVPRDQVQVRITDERCAAGQKTGKGGKTDDSRKTGQDRGAGHTTSPGEQQQSPSSQQAG